MTISMAIERFEDGLVQILHFDLSKKEFLGLVFSERHSKKN